MRFPGVLMKEHMQYENSRGQSIKKQNLQGCQIDRMKNSPHACLCSACRISVSLGFLFVTLLLNFKGVSSALEFLSLKVDIISCIIGILKFQAPPMQKRVFQKSSYYNINKSSQLYNISSIPCLFVCLFFLEQPISICYGPLLGTKLKNQLGTFLFIYLINIFTYNFTLCQTRPYFVRF